ncbi:hypothetical protein AGMMS49938_00610 [Fibrobacterales bacterium]|nr:hypothetical protein AGMMS49938_00610 [Fibrobacterales bacterium]
MNKQKFIICVLLSIVFMPAYASDEELLFHFSFFKPTVTSQYDFEEQVLERNGLNGMFEVGAAYPSFEVGFFIGGGSLGKDIGEFIVGGSPTKLLWIWDNLIAVPISVAIAYRYQWMAIENMYVTYFIDEPEFLKEPESYLNEKRNMSRKNLDIMPAIDLQIFFNDNIALYAGYMYRLNFAGKWEIKYKIPGKYYEKGKDGNSYEVPEEFNPLKDSKEKIFGVPGTLRFGLKFYVDK